MRAFAGMAAIACVVALWLLGVAIYLLTLYNAYQSGIIALMLSFFLPILSQLYWIWHLWSVTGVFFTLLTVLCIVWFALAAAALFLNSYAND
jgi:hypothetical protein